MRSKCCSSINLRGGTYETQTTQSSIACVPPWFTNTFPYVSHGTHRGHVCAKVLHGQQPVSLPGPHNSHRSLTGNNSHYRSLTGNNTHRSLTGHNSHGHCRANTAHTLRKIYRIHALYYTTHTPQNTAHTCTVPCRTRCLTGHHTHLKHASICHCILQKHHTVPSCKQQAEMAYMPSHLDDRRGACPRPSAIRSLSW